MFKVQNFGHTVSVFLVFKGQETLFIIFTQKLDAQTVLEVEFFENKVQKRVPGNLENEYTISVAAPGKYEWDHVTLQWVCDMSWKTCIWNRCFPPDMPAGVVSLTLYTDQFSVTLKPVTYYTVMGEISWCFETAADPVNFISQVRHDVT